MKRFLPYILIIAMILSSVSLYFFSASKKAEANPIVLPIIGALTLWKVVGITAAIIGTGWLIGGTTFMNMTVGKLFAELSSLIFKIASVFLTISGKILDFAMDKAVGGEFFRISAVETGWAVCRDVANLFFIFILLYIAIATILQLSSYGMKSLLAKLVIIALLVNFSLVITRMIIDASNVLAREFYSQLKIETIAQEDAPAGAKDVDGKEVSFKKGDLIIAHSASLVFINAIKIQTIFTTDQFKAATGKLDQFKIGMIYTGGTIVVLVTTFVFFATAILLFIRVVVLILLMILAPLAFLFMILPKTQQYASDWWNKLFNQAFFAPALMFLFYLSAAIISDPNFAEITDSGSSNSAATFAEAFSDNPSGFGIIFSFIIIIILMIASLVVAQKMGAYGAGMVQGWGKSLKKAAQGYAGRVGKRYVGRAAAYAEEKLEKSEGRFATTLKAVPFLQRGLARGAQLKKKEIGTYEKQYAGYEPRTLEQLKGKFGTTREARAAMEKIITKRKQKEQEDKILESGSSIDQVRILAQRARERAEELEKQVAAKEEKPKEEKPKEKPKEV